MNQNQIVLQTRMKYFNKNEEKTTIPMYYKASPYVLTSQLTKFCKISI